MSIESGTIYWVTGLSGAGKTTVCIPLIEHIRSLGRPVILLDGDQLRAIFGMTDTDYTRNQRRDVALRYSLLAKSLADQGVDVVIATISMYREVYAWNRENFAKYKEIYLDVPVDELKRRDPKKIYERAELGEITNVAGLDLQVDIPQNPDVHVVWRSGLTVEDVLSTIIQSLNFSHELKENIA